MRAELVFLDRDPLTADPHTIKDIKATRAIVGGRTVYQACLRHRQCGRRLFRGARAVK